MKYSTMQVSEASFSMKKGYCRLFDWHKLECDHYLCRYSKETALKQISKCVSSI